MLSRVRSVGLYVGDQEAAKRFWTDTMGFELVADTPMGPDPDAPRWIEVKPPADDTILVLFTAEEHRDRVGSFSDVLFSCTDIVATCRQLQERGVRLLDGPRKAEWGEWWAVFADPDGNQYGLGQDSPRR